MNMPTPGPKSASMLADEALDDTLSSLAQQDITEHSAIYEQLLATLQSQLNSTEYRA